MSLHGPFAGYSPISAPFSSDFCGKPCLALMLLTCQKALRSTNGKWCKSKILLQLARAVKPTLAGNENVTNICTIIQQLKGVEKEFVFSKSLRF